jgi:hypothetical protein
MIHLWAQQALEEDGANQSQVENQICKTASPQASNPGIGSSRQFHPAERIQDRPVVKDLLSETASPGNSVSSTAIPDNATKPLAENAATDQCTSNQIDLAERESVVVHATISKFAKKLFDHLPGTRDSDSAGKQLSDPVAECCRRIGLVDAESQRKEQAIDKTKQELDRIDQEMTLCGEGLPNLDGDTLEDLSMQLQLAVLEQMRELADLSDARRTLQMSLYKLCYDAEAFPSMPDDMSLELLLSKKRPDRGDSKPKGFGMAQNVQRASMALGDLSLLSPSRTW